MQKEKQIYHKKKQKKNKENLHPPTKTIKI